MLLLLDLFRLAASDSVRSGASSVVAFGVDTDAPTDLRVRRADGSVLSLLEAMIAASMYSQTCAVERF